MATYNEKFMTEAIKLALENVKSGNGGPFGAVVVKDGVVVGKGANSVMLMNDPTAHAEMMAIRDACSKLRSFSLEGCDIYSSCEPCPMCFGAIYWAKPDTLYFAGTKQDAADIGFIDAFIYEELNLSPEKRSIPTRHVMHHDTSAPFKAWDETENKMNY